MKRILTITTALCLVAGVAHAGGSHEQPHGQTAAAPTYNASATNNVTSQSRAVAGAQSRAASSATSGNAAAQGGAGGRSNASTGSVTVNNTTGGGYGGGYTQRNNTPDVFAPAINGGNPCTVGASGGLAVPAFGLSFGASGEGQKCSQRMTAAILFQAGMSGAAIQLLCRDPDVQLAMIDAGRPCQTTIAAWQNAGYRQRADGYWVR